MKVYLVHEEDGEYSDWRFNVAGVFSTHEKAVEYITSQRSRDRYGEHELRLDPEYGERKHEWQFGDERYSPKEVNRWIHTEDWYVTELELDVGAVVTHDEWSHYPQFGFPKVSVNLVAT